MRSIAIVEPHRMIRLGLEQVLARRVIADALATLPTAQREVLFHLIYCDRTGRETARLMKIPHGTVKSRSHHAVRVLHKTLRDHERGALAA